MDRLKKRIADELETGKHCAVYEPELERVWPSREPRREAKIAQFAAKNGWRLRFYSEGLCAIFDKKAPRGNRGWPRPATHASLAARIQTDMTREGTVKYGSLALQ